MIEHCFLCGSPVEGDAEPRCIRCGVMRTASPEKRIHARCPRCHDARLSPFAIGPVAIHVCGRCKGAFLPTSEWDTLLDTYVDAPLPTVALPEEPAIDDTPPVRPYRESAAPQSRPRTTDDLAVRVLCPTCDAEMDRLEFAGISGVVIDVCAAHGVWLDAGEMERLLASMRDRTSTAPLPEPSQPTWARPPPDAHPPAPHPPTTVEAEQATHRALRSFGDVVRWLLRK